MRTYFDCTEKVDDYFDISNTKCHQYQLAWFNKSSVVSEMGDRLAIIDGLKVRDVVPLSVGELGPHQRWVPI